MSEPIYTTIEIGGKLSASLVDKFLECISNDFDNLTGPSSREELIDESRKGPVEFSGTVNYGLCGETVSFCKENDLSFIDHSEAEGEYNAATSFWISGMETPESFYTDANNNPVITVNEIKPFLDLMYGLLKVVDKHKALPLYVNDKRVGTLISIGLDKGFDEFMKALQEEINEVLPKSLPTLPPLEIISEEAL